VRLRLRICAMALIGLLFLSLNPTTHAIAAGAAPSCMTSSTWLAEENAKTADRAVGQFMPRTSTWKLQIYTAEPSVTCGQNLSITVGSIFSSWHLEFWRVGWYDGAGARRIFLGKTWKKTTTPVREHRSQAVFPSPSYGFVDVRGGKTLSIGVTQDMPPGLYFARIVDKTGKHADAPFVIASKAKTGPALFAVSMLTATEYNQWGGSSGYKIDYRPSWLPAIAAYPQTWPLYTSARKPWARFHAVADGGDLSLIPWLEHSGIALDYAADSALGGIDLTAYPALVFGQHLEYLTREGEAQVETALRSGTNLAVFGSNALVWAVTQRSTTKSPRFLQVQRLGAADQFANFGYGPDNLLGTGTTCIGTFGSTAEVLASDSPLLQGITDDDRSSVPGIFEQEVDSSLIPTRAGTTIIAQSTRDQCAQPRAGRLARGQMTETILGSGAKVFNAGGFGLSCAARAPEDCPKTFGTTEQTTRFARQVINNVLSRYTD
jgi:hypothetical protein